ncbi:MAG: ChaN family lipoprotein [Bacteroidota bacterium]
MTYRILGLVTLYIWGVGPLFSQIQDRDFKIYATSLEREISLAELVEQVADVDVLFFGEEHKDSLGHRLQDALYGRLLAEYAEVTLSMEMFETDCQLVVDEYLEGWITEEKLIREGRAWNNYRTAYRPMVERAKANQQAVVAANAPRRYVNLVGRKGFDSLKGLSKTARRFLPKLPITRGDTTYERRFHDIMGASGHTLDDKFFQAQCTWDATMSDRIYRHWRKQKPRLIYHLNGRFHTDYQLGTFAQLRLRNRRLRIQNISCFSIPDLTQPNWSEHAGIADYIIVTRKLPAEK